MHENTLFLMLQVYSPQNKAKSATRQCIFIFHHRSPSVLIVQYFYINESSLKVPLTALKISKCFYSLEINTKIFQNRNTNLRAHPKRYRCVCRPRSDLKESKNSQSIFFNISLIQPLKSIL